MNPETLTPDPNGPIQELTAKFAIIDGTKIQLFHDSISTGYCDLVLEDVKIVIDKHKILHISGNVRLVGSTIGKRWVEDMEKKPVDNHCKMGYKTWMDRIKGIQKPYVESWWRYQETKPYNAMMNEWLLEL